MFLLQEIFLNVSKTGDLYKMCNIVDFLDLAKVIEDLPLTLSMQFTLCLSPMNIKHPFTKVIFRKVSRVNGGFLAFFVACIS